MRHRDDLIQRDVVWSAQPFSHDSRVFETREATIERTKFNVGKSLVCVEDVIGGDGLSRDGLSSMSVRKALGPACVPESGVVVRGSQQP